MKKKPMTLSMVQFKDVAKQIDFPSCTSPGCDCTKFAVPIEEMSFYKLAPAGSVPEFDACMQKVRDAGFVKDHSSSSDCHDERDVVIINRFTMRTENPKRTMIVTFSENFGADDDCRYQIVFEGGYNTRMF